MDSSESSKRTGRKVDDAARAARAGRLRGGGGGGSAITAEDLAATLGLSRSTVSIVLRGDAERRKISAATVQRVLEAARRYNYVPNQIAQSLRRQRTGIVSVVVIDFRNDWCDELMIGMLTELDGRHSTPFVAAHRNDPVRQEKELLAAISRRDDGVICLPVPGQKAIYDRVVAAGIPLVFIGDYPPDMPHVSRVCWDSGHAATVAIHHLIETGRKRIGYIGLNYPLTMHLARFANYEAALKRARLKIDPQWTIRAPINGQIDLMLDPLADIFAPGRVHPDALFAMNDGIALLLLDRLARLGVRVPDDVAVVGMGDLPLTAHANIALSTVRAPIREMGIEAARAVFDLAADPSRGPIERILQTTQLIVRKTTQTPSSPAATAAVPGN